MIPNNFRASSCIPLTATSPFPIFSKEEVPFLLDLSWDTSSMQNEKGMNVKRQRMFDEGKEEEEAVSGIPIRGDYNDDDILQGRGKGVSRHRGNRRFRKIIKRHCNAYTRAKNNRERRKIVDLVLGEVHNRGRFLELSSDSHWVMLTEKKIREKVSQALRYQQRVNVSGTEMDARSVDSTTSDGEDDTATKERVPGDSARDPDALPVQLFGEPTHIDQLEAMESLEEWGTEKVPARHQGPLVSDHEILASVGAHHLAPQQNSVNEPSYLDPHEEFEEFL